MASQEATAPVGKPFNQAGQKSDLPGHDQFACSPPAGIEHRRRQPVGIERCEAASAARRCGLIRQASCGSFLCVAAFSPIGRRVPGAAGDRAGRDEQHMAPARLQFESHRVGIGRQGRLGHSVGPHEGRHDLTGQAADVHQMTAGRRHVVSHRLRDFDGRQQVG